MAYTILFRRGTDNEWTQANPVLNNGELGFVTDTKRFKIGDGLTRWNDIPYSIATLENGKIPLNQLPDTVKINVFEVSTVAQRDLLDVQSGDICTVAEISKTFIYNGSTWIEILISTDFTGYATELFVETEINSLNLNQFLNSASVNFIVDNAITELNMSQYATESYVLESISDLNLPDSNLFQVDIQNKSLIYGNNIPKIQSSSPQIFEYYGTVGIGDSIFVSSSALLNLYPSASTVFYSTTIGSNSMSAAFHNFENSAIGYSSLVGGGFRNTAIGSYSMKNISPDISENRFNATKAKDNTGIGSRSLFSITTGSNNIAVGSDSLSNISTGNNNIAIGYEALKTNHDGSIFNGTNSISLGSNSSTPGNNTIKIGNGNHVVITDNPIYRYSDERDLSGISDITYGLDFINSLRPVEYQSNPRNGEETRDQLGFIASEVVSASASFTGYIDFSVEGSSDIKALAYDQFIPPIVKSIQQVDLRLVSAESTLESVAILSASVAALSSSVITLNEGDAVYETYSISSSGTNYIVSASPSSNNPIITLVKGRRYRFDLTGVNSSQPLAFRESDSVTNNIIGMTGNDPINGISGSSLSNYIFYSVPLNPPYTSIIYQSSETQNMGGVINLVDG